MVTDVRGSSSYITHRARTQRTLFHRHRMCVPPQRVQKKAAAASVRKAAGYTSDARLNLMKVPGTSFNPIGFLELPLFLCFAFLYRAQFRWHLLGPMFVLYVWKECVPMSTCLHRYFSHKGFKCGRATQFGLYTIGCLASQVRQNTKNDWREKINVTIAQRQPPRRSAGDGAACMHVRILHVATLFPESHASDAFGRQYSFGVERRCSKGNIIPSKCTAFRCRMVGA